MAVPMIFVRKPSSKPTAVALLAAMLFVGPVVARAAQEATESPPTPRGLESVDDGRVLSEIADRGLETLLRHALDAQGVPAEERDQLLAGIALARLRSGEPISVEARRTLVLDVVRNVNAVVAQEVPDHRVQAQAQLLMQQAQVLIDEGVGEEVRLLEYFGDDPERRRYVRPVAEAVGKMLDRAAELFDRQAGRVEQRITESNDPRIAEAKEIRAAATQARQLRLFTDYYRLLGLDTDDPQRNVLGDRLLEQVRPLDTERNPNRGFVRQFLGKIAAARGGESGRTAAREYFTKAVESGGEPAQVFDSYFGRAIAEAVDRRSDEARATLAAFEDWLAEQDLPDREPLLLIAKYRVADAASRTAESVEARRQADAEATRYLTELVEQHEGFRSVVTQQLLARMDSETDLTSLSPLLLDAIVDRGRAEAAKLAMRDPDGGTAEVDQEAIEQAVAAARELLSRYREQPGKIDRSLVARNTFVLGLVLQLLDRPAEAAEAYLAYGDLPGARAEQRLNAYRRALGIIDNLRRDAAPDSAASIRADEVEAKLLPILVDEYGDTTRAFDLANRLHRMGDLERAVAYYAKVPDDDPRAPDAAYFTVLAQAQRLTEAEEGSPLRNALLRDLPQLGRETLAELGAAADAATGSAKQAYRERIARLKVTLARLALNEVDDPQRALELLADIEQDTQGLDAAQAVLAEALPLRFQATAAAGDVERVTADLLTLLNQSEPKRGLALIEQFRNTLDRAFERASIRGDREAMARTMQTRAAVTPKLVEWIEQSDDPEYRRYVYNFRRFNAETQLQAALLTSDPAERRERLQSALQAFQQLESAENLERYRALLDELTPEQRRQVAYDREVVLNLGRIYYELENYDAARSRFARLLADRALGEATRVVVEDGVERQVPNDDYWEAHLKFIRSNLALGNAPEKMREQLERLSVIHGDAVGGRRWQREFEALRTELSGSETP